MNIQLPFCRGDNFRSLPKLPIMMLDMLREPPHWKQRRWVDQVVFVCGCGHSGTTLTLRILGAHPAVYAPNRETSAFLNRVEKWTRLRQLRREVEWSGKRILIEKSPLHIRHLSAIRDAVPGARFIVPVRDGRDVTASIGIRFSGDFQRGADRWINDNGILSSEMNASDLAWFRYEDLIADPAKVIASLCSFIEIPFDTAMLEYHQRPSVWQGVDGRTGDDPTEGKGHKERRAWQANQPIFDGRGIWETALPPKYAHMFTEGEAASLMRAFGYI